MSIAKHYETGESLPEDVYLKLLAARTFRAGSLSLRQVSAIWVFRFFNTLSSLLCWVFCFFCPTVMDFMRIGRQKKKKFFVFFIIVKC